MDISRSCKINKINWGALPELNSRLEKEGFSIDICSVTLYRFPDKITYNTFEEAANDVTKNSIPEYYDINIHGSCSTNKRFHCAVMRGRNIYEQEYLTLKFDQIDKVKTIDSIMEFLGLEPAEYSYQPEELSKTAFIAHRFDNLGTESADKLARFLELLGFEVLTGRAYSPQSVASKVRERIEKQSVVFAIVTSGDDNTWLTQESILSEVRGKPLIILKEKTVEFKSGLLADHEYIPFDLSKIESGFISILEGLREIGYFK